MHRPKKAVICEITQIFWLIVAEIIIQRVGLAHSNKEKLDTKEYSSLPFVNLKRKNEKTEQEVVLVPTSDEKKQYIRNTKYEKVCINVEK